MSPEIESRFISAIVKDGTGDRWRECRRLDPEALTDWNHRKVWQEVVRAESYDAAALAAASYFSHTTCGESYLSDRQALWLGWLESRGLTFAAEWATTLPRSSRHEWPAPAMASVLCESPPPTPNVLIDGVLYQGGTMLISGPSKSHKTYTMLDAGCAIAEGRPWLGFATTKTPVLYLNLELQDFAVASRLKQICSAAGTRLPKDLHTWNLRGRHVTLLELQDRLPAEIKRIGAGFVVIDPHYKVSAVSGMEENSNDSQGMLLAALEGVCNLNGAALSVAHHFAKGDASAKTAIDRASGGGVFARWGDVMLTFTPHEEPDAMTVEMALRNFAPVEPFVVRWDHPRWARDGQLDPSRLKQRGGRSETQPAGKALKALAGATMTYSEWHKASGMAETTFRRKRDELLESGKVESVGNFFRVKAA